MPTLKMRKDIAKTKLEMFNAVVAPRPVLIRNHRTLSGREESSVKSSLHRVTYQAPLNGKGP